MKILQILTELEPGGAERVVLNLSRGLVAHGHTVALAVLKNPPVCKAVESEFLKLGIHPFCAGLCGPADLFRIFELRKRLRAFAPDVVHAHLMHPNLISRLVVPGSGARLINTVHISERRPGKQVYFLLDGLTSGLCGAITAVSKASAAFHESKIHLAHGSILVVPNGCDPVPRKSPAELAEAKNRWQVNMCDKLIGCVGRLVPQKGFDLMIRTFRQLSTLIPKGRTWGVVILGDGPERETLRNLASYNTFGNIIFKLPGFEPEAASLADAFDAFAMPSRYEGYGLTMAEALNLGLPVVYNPVDSLPELCEGYPFAFRANFFRRENDSATAAALVKAVNLGRTAPKTLFTNEQMVEEYLKIYGNPHDGTQH